MLDDLITVKSETKQVAPKNVRFWQRRKWREIGRAFCLNGFVAVYMVKG